MPNKTAIEWTDYTSNPIAPKEGGWGCSKVSPGCDNCYAERLNKRMGNKRDFQGKWEFVLKHKELEALRKLPAGSKVFLGDMTDIFHPDIPWAMLAQVFDAMAECSHLTFQVLTKRPGRMAYFANTVWPEHTNCCPHGPEPWPANVWAGTSVESQMYAPRLDQLARVPAAVRFVSYEPALGPVDLTPWLPCLACDDGPHDDHQEQSYEGCLDWVIAGGESGPKARPPHPDWLRDLRDQCQAAGVPYFFKQHGEWRLAGPFELATHAIFPDGSYYPVADVMCPDQGNGPAVAERHKGQQYVRLVRVGKKDAGALLDGIEHREFPG